MIFEQATRKKVRFESDKGLLSVENLWDLSIPKLLDIGRMYLKEQKEYSSFMDIEFTENSKTDAERKREELVNLQVEILKHIIQTKHAERKAKEREEELSRKKQKLAELLERKEDELLLDKSPEEIKEMLQKLQ